MLFSIVYYVHFFSSYLSMVTATVELKSAEKDRSGFCKVSLSRVSFAVLIHSTSLPLTGTLQQKRR